MPPILSKDNAKNRFSKEKENKLSFLSVRFLFKSKTKQNKSPKTFIFFVEMQPILSKDSAKNRFSKEKENKLSFLSVRFLFQVQVPDPDPLTRSPQGGRNSFELFIYILFELVQ